MNHTGDGFPYYHYHFKTTYPYSVECLIGCVDGAVNEALNGPCDTRGVSQYNYSSIRKFSVKYGGDGVNIENWTGSSYLLYEK